MLVADSQASYSKWQSWLSEPTQVAVRKSSQDAYENESASQALATDESAFPGWIGSTGFDSLGEDGSDKVIKKFGSDAAAVQTETGGSQEVVSTSALYGTTPSGGSAPVNTDLTAVADGSYEAKSALTPTTLPGASSGQIEFSAPGFGVTFAPSSDAVPAIQKGSTLFYADADGPGSDTDVVTNTVPDGAEVTYVLRSVQSPTTQTLSFDLPSGWTLSPSVIDPRLVDVVDTSGTTQSEIMAPVAVDAQGQSVPTSYSILDGDSLQLTISDQGGGYAFPIRVDPVLNAASGNTSFTGWNDFSSRSSINQLATSGTNAGQGWQFTRGSTYSANDRGAYSAVAPSDAYINAFLVDDAYNLPASGSEFEAGIETSANNETVEPGSWVSSSGTTSNSGAERVYSASLAGVSYLFSTTNVDDGNRAEFRLVSPAAVSSEASPPAEDYAEGAEVFLTDSASAPTVSVTSHSGYTPGTWVTSGSGAPTDTVAINSSQSAGMGVGNVEIYDYTTGTILASESKSCSISNGAITCTPLAAATTLSYNTAGLPDGVNQVGVIASGFDGQQTDTAKWNVDVDGTAPVIGLSGTLSDQSNPSLAEGTYTLAITAADGTGGSTDVSGSKSISVSVDGVSQPQSDLSSYTPCSASANSTECSVTTNFSLNTASLPAGQNWITVSATDNAGNTSSSLISFYLITSSSGTSTGQTTTTPTATTPSTTTTTTPTVTVANTTTEPATETNTSQGTTTTGLTTPTDQTATEPTSTVSSDDLTDLDSTPPNCNSAYNPDNYTAAALSACGLTKSTSRTTAPLTGGGTAYTYDFPDDGAVTLLVPPAGFLPAQASNAQLEEYGLPLEPTGGTGDDADAITKWQSDVAELNHVPPAPESLVESDYSSNLAFSPNWSGYVVYGNYYGTTVKFENPMLGPSRCSKTALAIWAGIGGLNRSKDLGQDGIADNSGLPLGDNAWEESLPSQKHMHSIGFYVPIDVQTYATVSWQPTSPGSDTGRYVGQVGNAKSGGFRSWEARGLYSGGTADAIVERPKGKVYSQLANFGVAQFSEARTNNKAFDQYSANGDRSALQMWNNPGDDHYLTGRPSVSGDDGSFTVRQQNCG